MSEHTPTPWRVFKTTDGRKLVGIGAQDGQGILDCGFGVWAWDDAEGIANAELVVEAVNNHEALKAENERLRSELEQAKGQVEHWRKAYEDARDLASLAISSTGCREVPHCKSCGFRHPTDHDCPPLATFPKGAA